MAKKIGGSIVLEGASKYNNDLKDIKTNLAQLRSEMKVCNSQYSNTANTAETLSKKHQILEKEIEQVTRRVETYAKMQEDARKKQKEAADSVDKYTKELEEARQKLQEMEKSGASTNDELEDQKKIISDLEGELTKANSRYEDGSKKIKQYATAENNAQAELNNLNNELQNNDKYLEEAQKSADGCAKSIDEYGNEIKEAGEKTLQFKDLLAAGLSLDVIEAGLKRLCNGIKEVAQYSMDVGMSFESGMSKVAAISGATASEMEALTAKAKEMGATTMFSATESAEALSYMAMAGWKTEDMLAGLPAVMNLAAASGEDLAMVSDIITDDLTAFGLTAQDAAHFADVLAAASSNANTNVAMMGETFQYAGPIAGALGYSIEDLAVATGLMANSGIKASNAGTALRSIITRMAKPTKESAQAMKDLHIEMEDSQGNMYSFMEIMEQMREGFNGMTESEKAAEAAMLAGKTGMSGLLAIVNSSEADFNKLCEAIDNSTGAAEQMAETMQDNLKGKLTILQSALEGLGISVYEVFSEDMKTGVEAATEAVDTLQQSVTNGDIGVSLNKLSDSLGDMIENAVELGEKVLPVMIDALAWFIDNRAVVEGAIGGMLAAKVVNEAISVWNMFTTATQGAAAAQGVLNMVMNANPIGLVITAVGVLTGALIGLDKALSDQSSVYEEQYESVYKEIEAYDKFNESIKKNIDERKKNREAVDADKQVTEQLINELERLSSQTDLTTSQQMRMREIVDQLNAVYPDLGLCIDANTGSLNMSTDAIRTNIDALLEQTKAMAAQEDMVAIAKDMYEAEKELTAKQEERKDLLKELQEAERDAAYELENYGRITDDTQEKVTIIDDALNALNEEINTNKDNISTLGEEYETAASYVTDANDKMVDSAENSSAAIQEALYELSEEQAAELEKITGTVEEFSGMYDRMAEGAKASLAEINENLSYNAQAMSDYADNIHKAMEIAATSTDENTKNIVDYLISMGTDGAAELAQFVGAAQENSTEYNEILKNFGDYEAAKAEAETALADWNLGVNDGYDVIIETAETKHSEIEEGQQTMYDNLQKQSEEHKEAAVEMATQTQQDVAQATLDEQGTVETANQTVAQAAIDTTTSTLGIEGGRSSIFYDFGITIDNSLAQGISDGSSAVSSAISALCSEAVASVDLSGIVDAIDQTIAAGAQRAGAVYGK